MAVFATLRATAGTGYPTMASQAPARLARSGRPPGRQIPAPINPVNRARNTGRVHSLSRIRREDLFCHVTLKLFSIGEAAEACLAGNRHGFPVFVQEHGDRLAQLLLYPVWPREVEH